MALVSLMALAACKPAPEPTSLLDTGWFSDTAVGDTDTDDNTECSAQIVQTSPAANEAEWYWRDPATVWVDGFHEVYDARVIDLGGAPVGTTLEWADDYLTFKVQFTKGLTPDSQYLLEVTDCLGTRQVPFFTSSLGYPIIGGPGVLAGRVFDMRLDEGEFIEPGGMSAFLSPYLGDPILLQVQYANEEYIDFTGTQGYVDLFGDVQQSTGGLWNFPVSPFESSPYFEIHGDNVVLEILGYELAVEGFGLTGTFSPDATKFEGATLGGMLDTRTAGALIGQPNNEAAFCMAATAFGLSCEPCNDGLEFCMEVLVEDLTGDWVEDLSLRSGL